MHRGDVPPDAGGIRRRARKAAATTKRASPPSAATGQTGNAPIISSNGDKDNLDESARSMSRRQERLPPISARAAA